MLRCDNPQCVIKFDSEEAWRAAKEGRMTPSLLATSVGVDGSQQLRSKGNDLFRKGRFARAAKLYAMALSCPEVSVENRIKALSNRAAALIQCESWEDAVHDAEAVLKLDGEHCKARFRLATALIRLQRPEEAMEIALALSSENVDKVDPAVDQLVAHASVAVQETAGVYNIAALRAECGPHKEQNFHCDFASPAVELGVVDGDSGGRGCRARCPLGEGELLLAERALIYIPEQDMRSSLYEFKTGSNQMNANAQVLQIQAVVRQLCIRPALGRSLYSMSAGAGFDEPANAVPEAELHLVDLQRIRAICSSNSFGDYPSMETQIRCQWDRCRRAQGTGSAEREQQARQHRVKSGSGLYPKASLFNHSCTPNCVPRQFGNVILVHTTRAIAAGESLCISYVPYDVSYAEREKGFRNCTSVSHCPTEVKIKAEQSTNLTSLQGSIKTKDFAAFANDALL